MKDAQQDEARVEIEEAVADLEEREGAQGKELEKTLEEEGEMRKAVEPDHLSLDQKQGAQAVLDLVIAETDTVIIDAVEIDTVVKEPALAQDLWVIAKRA